MFINGSIVLSTFILKACFLKDKMIIFLTKQRHLYNFLPACLLFNQRKLGKTWSPKTFGTQPDIKPIAKIGSSLSLWHLAIWNHPNVRLFGTYGSAFCACHQNCDVTTDLLGRRYSVQGNWIESLVIVLGHHQSALASLQLQIENNINCYLIFNHQRLRLFIFSIIFQLTRLLRIRVRVLLANILDTIQSCPRDTQILFD